MLQKSQEPAHGVLQHTPLTQLPETHWAALVQGDPFGPWVVQVPPTQEKPGAQFALVEQPPGQASALPEQTYGEQVGAPAAPTGRSPSAGHVVETPSHCSP
jgi:hypothetical protein